MGPLRLLLGAFLDALAPVHCAGCDAVAAAPLCPRCVEALTAEAVPPPRVTAGVRLHAGFLHGGPARSAVHAGKYRGGREALRLVAGLAAERLLPELERQGPPHLVVPVPLGRRRRRQRGYNQAEVVAAAFASLAPGAVLRCGLVRRRDTAPQVGRDREGRRGNLDEAFLWDGPSLPARAQVWLVDDVVTTGATASAAARALQRAGGRRIESVAVTMAPSAAA